jgi:hypothetical protein
VAASQWFWLLFVLCVILGVFLGWPAQPADRQAWRPLGVTFIIFLLLGLLGLGVFGWPIK